MIHKKQSYLTSKYLFFPLPVAVGVSKSFLWKYKRKQEKALLWNLLGNVSCTNIHPQMVWLPSGPVSSHYITWLAYRDLANIFWVLKSSEFFRNKCSLGYFTFLSTVFKEDHYMPAREEIKYSNFSVVQSGKSLHSITISIIFQTA